MEQGTNRLWTTTRKLPGNILPVVLGAPFVLFALKEFPSQGMTASVAMLFTAFPVATWVATNFLGLIGNGSLKREMGRRLHQERPFDKSDKTFVGFARPGFQSMLDPHEDVGLLIIHERTIEFWGSAVQVEIKKNDLRKAVFRGNAHSLVGLGRWLSLDGEVDGKPIRLLIEPRERPTLLGNRLLGAKLKSRIEDWMKA